MKNYIIDKNNSQKHKKAYGIKKQKKRSNSLNQISSKAIVITTIFIGTLGFIKNNPTNSEQDDITNNTTISYKVDKNLPIYNDLNIKSQNNLNTVYFREKADLFEVNCHKDIRYVEKFIKSDDYKYFEKYANMYGIDPHIQESLRINSFIIIMIQINTKQNTFLMIRFLIMKIILKLDVCYSKVLLSIIMVISTWLFNRIIMVKK